MDIIIRTDASIQIGSGHVMRCLTIAKHLSRLGHQVAFWMEPLEGNYIETVRLSGYDTIHEVRHADMLIVDHYELDIEWEQRMRAYFDRIVVIDDLANRKHDCDMLIDPNMASNYLHRYDRLVPSHCKKLLGPQYLIMREEFIEARKKVVPRTGEVENLLVFMGGSDPTNETMKVLRALQQTATRFKRVDVVTGSSNPERSLIRDYCTQYQYRFHCQINYMAELMINSDFAIGAGGSAAWERCYVGLPSSVTTVADNQVDSMVTAKELGMVIHLGWHEQVTVETYAWMLNLLPQMGDKLKAMSIQGLEITKSQDKPNPWLWEMVG